MEVFTRIKLPMSCLMNNGFAGHQSMARSQVIPSEHWNMSSLHNPRINLRGSNTIIAIIDGGVNIQYELLHTKYNGGRGSISGRNFVPELNLSTQIVELDPSRWQGQDHHGTAVATIVGGYTGSVLTGNFYCYGIAPDAYLYVCRVFREGKMYGKLLDVLQHLLDLKTRKDNTGLDIDIICMSLGFGAKNRGVEDVLSELSRNGVLLCAAAGNKGDYQQGAQFPASDPNVLSIGALKPQGQISDLNPRDGVDVYAPGEDIAFPIPNAKCIVDDGTSYATPMVTGFLSLLIQCAKAYSGSAKNVVKMYHDVRFLQQLFLKRELCDQKRLFHTDKFLTGIISRYNHGEKNVMVQLIQEVYDDFEPDES